MLIYDLIDPQELIGFARALEFPQFTLNTVLPDRPVQDLEYRFSRNDLVDQDVANYRAWDAEAPIAARQPTARVVGEIPPLSKKIRLGEEQRLRLQGQATGEQSALIDQIFDDTTNMVRAVQARIELARGQALSTGAVTIAENGVVAEVDFGMDPGQFVTPAVLWNDPTATIVANYTEAVEAYIDRNGFAPGGALTSTSVVGDMLRNDEIRTLAASLAGTPALVTRAALDNVFGAFSLPPIATYDTSVMVDGVSTRVIDPDLFILLPPAGSGLGNTLYGVTAEALELRTAGQIVAQQQPGIVAVIQRTFDPVATWTKAAGIALPVLANAQQITVMTVR